MPVDKVRRLLDSYSLISDGGARAATCAAVLRHFLGLVPGDAELSELLGKELLRDGQVREAIRVLSAIGANALTPRGAAALTEAAFRSKELPDPIGVIGRVDWLVGNVAQQLREVPRWQRGPELLRLAELVAENAPPDVGAFLSEVGRVAAREQLERLFSLWLELDLQAALNELVTWVEASRVQSSEQWVRDALQLALEADEKRTIRAALDLLAREAERTRDPVGMLDLVDTARDHLRSADGRDFTVKWLREVVSAVPARGDAEWMDRAATALLAVISDMRALPDDSPEYALALLLITRASDEAAVVLRQAVDERRPRADVSIRDVTTVAEALQAAAERFPDLVVLPEAEKSAARRGTGSVKKAREALFQVGEIAQRYAAGELDEGLDEALAALPEFRPDISDTSKRQYAKEYARVLPDGRRIMLGPHFDIGGEDGRAYLYIDREGKRIVLGHCGSHLRGRRDS